MPTIINVTILECVATYGGGMWCQNYASPHVINCRFIDNISNTDGGGLYCHTNGQAKLEYCFFYNNSAYSGTAIMIVDSEVEISNCTFVGNTGTTSVIKLWRQDFSIDIDLQLDNSIISWNYSYGGSIAFNYCSADDITITYTDIFNNVGGDWTGLIASQYGQNGNISEYPLFVHYQEGDCHLTENSPCIDAGDPLYPFDPDGTICDMGAFYFDQSQFSHQIILSTGFSFMSSRIIPEEPDMLIVMADVINDNLDYIRNSLGQTLRKIGPNWVNGIGDWITDEGYLVKMFSEDTFTLEGEAVDPTTPIPVTSGFQFVSYFPVTPMDAMIAFGSIIGDDLDYIRNSQGEVLRKIGPNWVNGIGDCQPGQGYLVKMFTDGEIIYPASTKSSGKTTTVPTHFAFGGGNPAEAVYTLYLEGLEIGDEVAAYNGDIMVGATRICSQNIFENELPVFSTLINGVGYEKGKPIILKVWSENNFVSIDFTMETMYDSYISETYPDEDGKYSIVNITKGISIVSDELIVYPNPATDLINIVPSMNIKSISIFNNIGQTVYQGNETQININNFESGVYIIRINNGNEIINKKILIE
jgi:hypothetical protein